MAARDATLEEVRGLAYLAHYGQMDKIGVPYFEHVKAVAAGLAPFGEHMEMAGLCHDMLEDTDWTAEEMRGIGIPERVVHVVEAVTNEPGVPYQDKIKKITGNRDALLVKISDNAHNSREDRASKLPEETRERLAKKYRKARDVLWVHAAYGEIETIVDIVNPALLHELADRYA